ncbi:hypothetical protein TNCV_3526681 [Trichonephila clavipes]|nr:hypothetical protein TNCV_3526681 [Trichonephila clavipes]
MPRLFRVFIPPMSSQQQPFLPSIFMQTYPYVGDLLLDKASKPRFPDSINHPIAVMPPSRMQNTTLAMPLIEDLSRYGIEDCSYSPEAPKSNAYS